MGFTGVQCETVDACASSPCHSAATCQVSEASGSYYCLCPPYFSGVGCDFYLLPCTDPNNHCTSLNEGTCMPNGLCNCTDGYHGLRCEVKPEDDDHCQGYPCQHGGICTSLSTSTYGCHCQEGFNGSRCETEIDECGLTPRRCKNGATCVNSFHSFSCVCVDGYTGRDCGGLIHPCAGSPCQHEGTCANHGGYPYCQCLSGMSMNYSPAPCC